MAQFTWQEMKAYWRAHAIRWSVIDYARDPDGLSNVCHPGAPLWLNRYYDWIQRKTFLDLLGRISPAPLGARALDIGCGAGRWSRLLSGQGYSVVGVDLQPELVASNRRRAPHIRFECVSLQDYRDEGSFNLVVSVTVLQHNPYEEQAKAITKMREMLGAGGHALVLEDTGQEAPGLFPREIAGWRSEFERAGFTCLAQRPYDYSPFIRFHWRLAMALRNALRGPMEGPQFPTPETYLVPGPGRLNAALRMASDTGRFVAVMLDRFTEPVLRTMPLGLNPMQCGFLFRVK